MSQRKKLILHIGLQKTGTSSIQVMLHSSAAALREAGYFYPALPVNPEQIWNSPFRHNIIAATYADFSTAFDKLDLEQEDLFWQSLMDNPLTPILSAEDFSRQQDFGRLAKHLEPFDVTIVVYLRRQIFSRSLCTIKEIKSFCKDAATSCCPRPY